MATAAPIQPTPAHKLAEQYHPTENDATIKTSSSSTYIPRGPVTATLNFYAPPTDGSKPYNFVEDPPAGVPKSNYSEAPHEITINDIRGRENEFSTDVNAFAALSVPPSAETEFNDDEHIKQVYYPEVEKLLLDSLPGSHRILIFDHTIRRGGPKAPRAPVTRVHIDQTGPAAKARVSHHLPDEAETLWKGRYRIVNVWRPLNGPVRSFPLAVADSTTVKDEDLVGIEHRYPDRTGETAGVKHAQEQWYYWSGMGNDERLLLKCYDSDGPVGRNGRVPHTAFIDPRTPEGAPDRESIEVRALVFG